MATTHASEIKRIATVLGMDPVDLATIISYETGGTFNPAQTGPTTKWGQHIGLIQMGDPQRKQYGYDPQGDLSSQYDAVARYFQDRGYKPGMGLMDAYSTVNAGAPGLYDRSDAAAGGMPGTVADKVNSQMRDHRMNALNLLGRKFTPAGLNLNSVPAQVGDLALPTGIASTQTELLGADPSMWQKFKNRLGDPKVQEGISDLRGILSAGNQSSAAPTIQQSSIGADNQQAAIAQMAPQLMASVLRRRVPGLSLGG